jgi:hypothetical protein
MHLLANSSGDTLYQSLMNLTLPQNNVTPFFSFPDTFAFDKLIPYVTLGNMPFAL